MKWRRAGLTLLETLIAVGLMVLILMAGLNVMGLGLSWWQQGRERMDAQQNARVALMHMIKDIQAAVEIVPGSNSEVLIIATPTGKRYKYELKEGNLRRAVKNRWSATFEGYNLLAYNVRELKFSYDQPQKPEAGAIITIRLSIYCPGERDFKITTAAAIRMKVINKSVKL